MGFTLPSKPLTRENMIYLIYLHETSVDPHNGRKEAKDIPQYHLGAYLTPVDARKKCEQLNNCLWKSKEADFNELMAIETEHYQEQINLYESGDLDYNPGELPVFNYNDIAKDKDRKENYYNVVPVEIKTTL